MSRPVLIREKNDEFEGFAFITSTTRRNRRWFVNVCVNYGPSIEYPLEQARDLFPTMIVQYIIEHRIPASGDYDLAWVLSYNSAHCDAVFNHYVRLREHMLTRPVV
jgi:hypothetical protein